MTRDESSRRAILAGASTIAAAVIASCGSTTISAQAQSTAGPSARAVELKLAMRKLWEDHITYTRNFIISTLGGLQDPPAVTQRLLRNQDDIGAAIKPYYGDAAGTQLSQLLRSHITLAADVVTAAKAGDTAQLTAKQRDWSANGRQIAAFLAGANPNWRQADLENMLQRHLDLTTGEVTSRLHSDWDGDIHNYDQGHEHMLNFADTLSDGIVAQHPDRFASA